MNDIPENLDLAYDSLYLDFHSDTTDFEETQIWKATNKNGNHSLLHKRENNSSLISNNSSKKMCKLETMCKNAKEFQERQNYITKKSKILDSGDQLRTITSKRSLIRHKVMPCLSGMFKRSNNNAKKMSIIKENFANLNKDNGCQTFCFNYEPKNKKVNRRRQCFTVHPIFAVERKFHADLAPIQPTKFDRGQFISRRMRKSEYTNVQYSLTSSSEPEHLEALNKKDKGWKWKKSYENNVKTLMETTEKNYPNYDQSIRSYPSRRRRRMPFQVYNNTRSYCPNNTATSPICSINIDSTTSAVPSTCSGFWDQLFTKINNKYATQRAEVFKPCNCHKPKPGCPPKSSSPKNCPPKPCPPKPCPPKPCPTKTCPPDACCHDPPCVSTDRSTPLEPGTPKSCSSVKSNKPEPHTCPVSKFTCSCTTSPIQCGPVPAKSSCQSLKKGKPKASPCPSVKQEKKAVCKCSPPQPGKCSPNAGSTEMNQPCQMPHDCLTASVSKKYNGEILCIHNPPCVLINGCLNLPYPKPEPTVTATMWPVVECNRASFQHMLRKKYAKESVERSCQYEVYEQSCQYQAFEQSCQYQYLETPRHRFLEQSCQYEGTKLSCQSCQCYQPVSHSQKTEEKKEKITQSSCSHQPPCEVKRICCRPKFDPKLQTSCTHVPICENIPICSIDSHSIGKSRSKKTCKHKPKCIEVPACTRSIYDTIIAKDEACTQVRPKNKIVCRHEPRCILIPDCLAQVCADAFLSCDAIPDCVHQPECEMIPACCGKIAKEMVSGQASYYEDQSTYY